MSATSYNEEIISISRELIGNSYLQTNDIFLNDTVLYDEELRGNCLCTIHDYSKWIEQGKNIKSQDFSIDTDYRMKWQLLICSMGQSEANEEYVSIYLQPKFSKNLGYIKLQTDYTVYLFDNQNKVFYSKNMKHVFSSNCSSHGWTQYVPQSLILNKNNNILQDDKLTILCSVKAYKMTGHKIGKILLKDNTDLSGEKEAVISNKNTEEPNKKFKEEKQNAEIQNKIYHSLYQDALFSDVNLIMEEYKIKAHKCVLAAASPVFLEYFKKENKAIVCVQITDLSIMTVKEMLRYIYINKLENLDNVALELMIAANKFKINDLQSICEERLCKNINMENIEQIITVADTLNAEKLFNSAVSYILKNKEEFKKKLNYKQFISLHPKLMSELIWSMM